MCKEWRCATVFDVWRMESMRAGFVWMLMALCVIMPIIGQPSDPKNLSLVRPGTGNLDRVALVIGNAAYKDVSPLQNTINDAQDIRDTLRDLGFEVIYRENATEDEIRSGLSELAKKSKNKEAVLYYSGHGVQLSGVNYLLPVDVDASEEAVLKLSAIDLDTVLMAMSPAKKRIIILDACRNNPYTKSIGREIGKGLALVRQSPDETLIIYATDPNEVASDNPGERNGLFTKHLLKYMKEDGLKIEDCMKQVTKAVSEESHKKQKPWVHGSVISDFYFSYGPKIELDLQVKLYYEKDSKSQQIKSQKVWCQVMARNQGAEGQIDVWLVLPVGLKDKEKEWPLQWKSQRIAAKAYPKWTYTVEVATSGNFEIVCRAEHKQKVVAEAKKQIVVEDIETIRQRAKLATLLEAKRKAEVEAQRQADLLAAEKLKAELAEAKRKTEEAEAQRWQAEAKRRADEAEAQRLAAQLAEARRKADEAEAKRKADEAEAQRLQNEIALAQRQNDLRRQAELLAEAQRQAEARLQAEIRRQNELTEAKRQEELKKKEEARKQQEEAQRREWASMASNPSTNMASSSAASISGFTFLREATYTCNGITNRMKEYRHNQTGLEFVLIPGGTFQMGSNDGDSDEKPVHTVTLSPYLISKTEVTQGVWKKIIRINPSYFTGDDHPVEKVSWRDCQEFCQKTGLKLPSEAQWECAARGGSTTKYYWGNSESETKNYGWYEKNSGRSTHPVAQKPPNAYGLYDTAGNVYEWCQDLAGSYSSDSATDPLGRTSSGSDYLRRGGSLNSSAGMMRSADRAREAPGNCFADLGFRVCATVKP